VQIPSDFQRRNQCEDRVFSEMWSQEAVDGIQPCEDFMLSEIWSQQAVDGIEKSVSFSPLMVVKEFSVSLSVTPEKNTNISLDSLFEEVARRQESDSKCPVPGCAKDVHHGKPCEPKTPPSQVMREPDAPPPIKRRRTSIMAPLDSKFEGKRLSFDPLNTAFSYDSE